MRSKEVTMNVKALYSDDVTKGFLTWSIIWGLVACGTCSNMSRA